MIEIFVMLKLHHRSLRLFFDPDATLIQIRPHCASDEDCAQTIASNSRFEREFIAATAKLPADEDDTRPVVADPLLRKALKPEDD